MVRPAIYRLAGDRVGFVDGTEEPIDRIIYATGYRISLPFLSSSLMTPRGRDLALYRRIAPPSIGGLFLAGFLDAPGGPLPVVETQAEWIAAVLIGRLRLSPPERMWRAIHRGERRTRERFPAEKPSQHPLRSPRLQAAAALRSPPCIGVTELEPEQRLPPALRTLADPGHLSVQMAVEEVDSHGDRLLTCVRVVGHNVASPGKVVGLH